MVELGEIAVFLTLVQPSSISLTEASLEFHCMYWIHGAVGL